MIAALSLHPRFTCDAVQSIVADVALAGPSALTVRYQVRGDPDAMTLPAPAAPERTDGLWRHTCLEAFAAEADGKGYVEFNFAPSTQWASYRFDRYREGMRAAGDAPPTIHVARTADGFELAATFDLPHATARLGLSAIIEEASGRISYWALRHPPGRPDFHHADGFVLELPAPSGP